MEFFLVVFDSRMLHWINFNYKIMTWTYDVDIWGLKLMWCKITCYIIIFLFSSFFGFFLDCGIMITFLSWHAMNKFTCCEKKEKVLFLPQFCQQFFWTPFQHDLHVYVFTMMYMFVNHICTRYIKACIHQWLNPRPHGNTMRF